MLVTSDLAADDQVFDAARAFGGISRLYGVTGAKAIANAHVVVVGIGGVGSWSAEALSRSSVGRLTLIDLDHVAESNINRQIHALTTTVGMAKVQAMKARIREINPNCEVKAVEEFASSDNWLQLLPPDAAAVIDACDHLGAKLAMALHARQLAQNDQGVIHVVVGAAGGKVLAHQVEVDDIMRVTHDPLIAKLRSLLRREVPEWRSAKTWGLPCVFSREPSVASRQSVCDSTQQDQSLNCQGFGSAVHVTAAFGFTAAGVVLNAIAHSASEKI